jgi:hypothetical protein
MAQPGEELVLQPRDLREGPKPEPGTLADEPMDARGALVAPEPMGVDTASTDIDVTEPSTEGLPTLPLKKEKPTANLCDTSHKLRGWKKSPGEMTTKELDDLIVMSVAACGSHVEKLNNEVRERLYPALLEMEKRYNKKQGARSDLKALEADGWHEYLESRGVTPATFRKWKSRNAVKELEGYLLQPKPKRKKKDNSSEVAETEQNLLAQAGLRLAKTMLNPLLTAAERAEKGQELSEQLIGAAEGGVYELNLPEHTGEYKLYAVEGANPDFTLLFLATSSEEALSMAREYECWSETETLLITKVSRGPIMLRALVRKKGWVHKEVKFAEDCTDESEKYHPKLLKRTPSAVESAPKKPMATVEVEPVVVDLSES